MSERHAARTPVLVGVGVAQQKEQDWRNALEPVALMQKAAMAALVDAGASDKAARIGQVLVPEGLWAYGDPARTVADAIGAANAQTTLVKLGVLQQTGIAVACDAIAGGSCEATLVVGGEARYRALRATIAGEDAQETPDARVPDETLLPEEEFYLPEETGSGLGYMPVNYYAILDSAYRHARGWSVAEGRDRVAALYNRFSAISESNPHAWKPGVVPTDTIRNPGDRNPMLAFPYTKLHNTSWNVDQAGAMLFCSVQMADQLGIPETQRVYPLASAQCEQMLSVALRRDLGRVPGVAAAGRRLETSLGLRLADVDLVDLYSCFPVAVLAYATELGLSLERDLTITGGMPFAGGPLNNYVIQATCRLAELLRVSPGSTGLVTSVSGLMTKQGLGLWSSTLPELPYQSLDVTAEVSAANPPMTVLSTFDGSARVAGYTVLYEKGERQRGIAMLDTLAGERIIAWTEDRDLMTSMERDDWVGRDVTCRGNQLAVTVSGA